MLLSSSSRWRGRVILIVMMVILSFLANPILSLADNFSNIYTNLKNDYPDFIKTILDTGKANETDIQSFIGDLDAELDGIQLTEENFKMNLLFAIMFVLPDHQKMYDAMKQAYPAQFQAFENGQFSSSLFDVFKPIYNTVKAARLAPTTPPLGDPPPVSLPALSQLTLAGNIQTLSIGDTYNLELLALSGKDQNGNVFSLAGKTITWNSSNSSIAAINGNTLSAEAAGNAQIIATVDGKISNELTVIVAAKPATPVTGDKQVDQQLASGTTEIKLTASSNAGTASVGLSGSVMQKIQNQGKSLVADLGDTQIRVEPGVIKVKNNESLLNFSAVVLPSSQVIQLVGKAGSAYKVGSKVVEIKVEEINSTQVIPADVSGGIELTLGYDAGVNPDYIDLYWYNPATGVWEPQRAQKIDRVGRTITIKVTHLSTWAVMEYKKTFVDIQGYWAQPEIEAMASKHIINGISSDRFAPQASVTRAEFAAMIVRTLNLKFNTSMVNPFKDVNTGMKLHNEIVTAAYYGLVNGYTLDQFRPNEPISRQQLATLMARALLKATGGQGVTGAEAAKTLAPFQDAGKISPQLKNDVALAVQQGIVKGMSTVAFAPAQPATRAQAAVMLKRLYDRLPQVK